MKVKDSVEFKKSPPSLWRVIRWFYPEYNPETDIFAFGDTIYIPEMCFKDQTEFSIPEDKILHELTHLEQMGYSKVKAVYHFLRCYFDRDFYYRMEIQAYRRQYHYLMGNCDCGDCGDRFVNHLTECLSKFFTEKREADIVKDIKSVV